MFGQDVVRGRISVMDGPAVSVRVDLLFSDSTIRKQFVFTDRMGLFQFNKISTAIRGLQFSGMQVESKTIFFKESEMLNNLDIELQPKVVQLSEVFVKPKMFKELSRDTVELDPQQFAQGDERHIEDLLKKIPGIQIDRTGLIKIGNQVVEHVMLDGDDMFGKGYKLLTQSLTLQAVDKIQILQRHANNKLLKGIERSDRIAINLKLKNDVKRRWHGSLFGSGNVLPSKYYDANVNLMNFGKKSKYYFIGAMNNTGAETLRYVDDIILTQEDDLPGQLGKDISTPSLLETELKIPQFSSSRSNFNKDKLTALHGTFRVKKNLKAKWMGFANIKENLYEQSSMTNVNLQDIQFENSESIHQKNKSINLFARLELQYDINERENLTYSGSISQSNKVELGDLMLNERSFNELMYKDGWNLNQNLLYTSKIDDRKAWLTAFKVKYQSSPIDYSMENFQLQELFNTNETAKIFQQVDNNLAFYGLSSQYLHRLSNERVLSVTLKNEYSKKKFRSAYQLIDSLNSIQQVADFSNDLTTMENTSKLMFEYSSRTQKLEWTPSISFGHTYLRRIESIESEGKGGSHFFVSPALKGRYSIHRKGELQGALIYQQFINNAILDYLPNYNHMGSRNFTKGLDDIGKQSSIAANMNYIYGKMSDRLFINFANGYILMFDYLSNHLNIHPQFSLSQLRQFKNKTTQFHQVEFNYYIDILSGNVKLIYDYNKSKYEMSVEGEGIKHIRNTKNNVAVEYRSVWKSWFNMHMGWNRTYNVLDNGNKNEMMQGQGFVNLSLKISPKLRTALKNELYFLDIPENKERNNYLFSDFSVYYEFKQPRLSLELTAKNLLDVKHYKNVFLSDSYQASMEYKLLPRQIMLGAHYSF